MSAKHFEGRGLKKFNMLFIPTGCQDMLYALKTNTYVGGYKFDGNERLIITSADSNCDAMYLIPYKWEVITIQDGLARGRKPLK